MGPQCPQQAVPPALVAVLGNPLQKAGVVERETGRPGHQLGPATDQAHHPEVGVGQQAGEAEPGIAPGQGPLHRGIKGQDHQKAQGGAPL